jgi:O-antigen/teichoic acid export membrane protein
LARSPSAGLYRNTSYNLAGSLAPLAVAIVTVPLYLRAIGDIRYGVLAITWLFVGYFGVFDLGLSRATAFQLAQMGGARPQAREQVFWTALILNLGFGLLGGLVLVGVATVAFGAVFSIPGSMRAEVLASLPWIGASLPLATVSGVMVGALQGQQRFGMLNVIGFVNSSLTQFIPLAVAWAVGPSLGPLIAATVVASGAGVVILFVVLWRVIPLGRSVRFDRGRARLLFSYGGWVAVSNFISPIMTTMDRLLIGALLSVQAVTYYTIPYNLVTRALILPSALTTSAFPQLAKMDTDRSRELGKEAVAVVGAVMSPVVVLGILALPIFLTWWVGTDVALHSAHVGMVILLGVWINGLAYVPYAELQARNRPRLTAIFHLVEVVPFLMILAGGIHLYGLLGAAVAWSTRVGLDAVLLFRATDRMADLRSVIPGAVLAIAAFLVAPSEIVSLQSVIGLAVLAAAIVWALLTIRPWLPALRAKKPRMDT